MSHFGRISVRLRAAIAIVAIWALTFAAAASGAATANATDVVFKSDATAGMGLFACFKRHMTQRADVQTEKAPQTNPVGKAHCSCCLAASAAAAVLPPRVPALTRAAPAPRPVFYCALAPDAPKNSSSRSINGARAPPASL
jgi:hypothetical protein